MGGKCRHNMQPLSHARFGGQRTERLRIDASVSRAFRDLEREPKVLAAFDSLLRTVRTRSVLLDPFLRRSELDPVEALRNLALRERHFLRPLEDWEPVGRSRLPLVHSLAQHLLARYPTPRWLGRVWFGPRDREREAWREAACVHGAGTPLRRALGGLGLTRRMERFLLSSPEHLRLPAAVRRAEILALGGSAATVAAVVQSRLGRELERVNFWRGVLRFLCVHDGAFDPGQVARIVEFIEEVRHRPRVVEGVYGRRTEAPLLPDFDLAGRTPKSLERLMAEWGRVLAGGRRPCRSWASSGLQAMTYQAAPGAPLWHWVELLDTPSLIDEGRRMRHCVGTYGGYCRSGAGSIWSLRRQVGDGPRVSVLTVDVERRKGRVDDARASCNRKARGLPRELLLRWARRNSLGVAPHLTAGVVAREGG